MLLNHPEAFDAYYAGSPSLHYDDGVLFDQEAAYAQKHDDMPVKLLVTAGSKESCVGDVQRLERRLIDRAYAGLQMQAIMLEGKDHITGIAEAWTQALLFLLGR